MDIYFIGFKDTQRSKNELRGAEIHEMSGLRDFMDFFPKDPKNAYLCIDGTEGSTLKKNHLKELLQEIRKHPGMHTVMVRDEFKKANYRDVLFLDLENGESTDLRVANYVKKARRALNSFVGNSKEIRNLKSNVFNLAFSDPNALILGETGTGKTLLAKLIHEITPRTGDFVSLNCAAVPETLLESELFGHARGAFTSANTSRYGLVQKADAGHMFLDEIAELPTNIQAKLLHVVEEGIYNVIGDPNPTKVNVRFISATNKDLSYLRKDLFFRLSEHVLEIPPLRQRKEDIPEISDYFFETHGYEIKFRDLPSEVQDSLFGYSYPGNVRELQSILGRYTNNGNVELPSSRTTAVFKTSAHSDVKNTVSDSLSSMINDIKQKKNLPDFLDLKGMVVEELEKQYVSLVLRNLKWNKHETAKELGISYRYLNKLILKYGIDRRANRGT